MLFLYLFFKYVCGYKCIGGIENKIIEVIRMYGYREKERKVIGCVCWQVVKGGRCCVIYISQGKYYREGGISGNI